jgi:excisionase family DNA binding protein
MSWTANGGAQVQEGISSEWITYEDAQRLTSLGRTTLWRICSAEDSGIEVARVGRAVRINRSSLTAYMKRSAEESRSS